METGHGEEILIADGNFPHKSKNIKNASIYLPVFNIAELLEEILYFFPLDKSVESAAFAMESVKLSDRYLKYLNLIENNNSKLELVDRFKFYGLAEKSVGIIVTADITKGGNILIKKGVVTE